jgi:hypothetical protein
MNSPYTSSPVLQAWAAAALQYRIAIVLPFDIHWGSDRRIYTAFLPHFGSPTGMLFVSKPNIAGAQDFGDFEPLATRLGYYFSMVRLPTSVDDPVILDSLNDWGYYGPRAERPKWLESQE